MAITGSVQEKNSVYYAVINLKDEKGKRKQKWISTHLPVKGNKRRAEKFLRDELQKLESKNVSYYSDITVAEYFENWLSDIQNEIKPNTYRGYRGNMVNHIIPYFKRKGILLQELKPYQLTEFYKYEATSNSRMSGEKALSPRTIKHHHQNISKALADAVEQGLISVNPASAAKKPRGNQFNASFLNAEQMIKLSSIVKGTSIELPITLCCIYGLRRSEVLGLKWSHVDFVNGTIWICETLQQGTKKYLENLPDCVGGNYVSSTKTASSNRTLPMTKLARMVLEAQLEKRKKSMALLGRGYSANDYVCTFDNGSVITPNYLTRTFHKIIKDSDLPMIRLHDLRHSVASNLLNKGFTVVQVAEWLGHSSSATTLKFYAHIDKTSKIAIAEALDKCG
ncbi:MULTISPECIES: site-specific integrase [unclassified Ruminococcus]|uniref:tyrosine-type recombinase/integrase n=1 Tax=unclassified Ruminococcus TaxID=2608920 RepID=UPI002109A4F5|nr:MULTISPECIES: site-specific integrase [unclassified Ruminococcus]MCQ4021926.1 tyrosine-type recombinase/integrase [Ruminococcus sp. zg-924]MCQ4115662.1 tyrosine-type recombinase/integrase [Ruminococcus sp. zg-921]